MPLGVYLFFDVILTGGSSGSLGQVVRVGRKTVEKVIMRVASWLTAVFAAARLTETRARQAHHETTTYGAQNRDGPSPAAQGPGAAQKPPRPDRQARPANSQIRQRASIAGGRH